MANFLKGLVGLAKHPLDEAEFLVKGARDVVKGDRSVGDLFGDHQDMMSENITVPLGGRNKLTENSDAVAGAIVGGVLAAPLMAGAGGSAAGGASGGAAGASSPFSFSLGNIGSYFGPGGGDKIGALWDSAMGPGDAALGNLADLEAGGAEAANLGLGSDALKSAGGGFDWEKLSQTLQSIKSPKQEMPKVTSGGRSGGGFRFDSKPYQNELLTREYASLYNQPLYK
ncbi:MAG: hypothetical protein ACRC6V_19365 [Bacteroidales bacterium]